MGTPRTERLDQILIRLGFVTAEQVAAALRRQQGLGGRLVRDRQAVGARQPDRLARRTELEVRMQPAGR